MFSCVALILLGQGVGFPGSPGLPGDPQTSFFSPVARYGGFHTNFVSSAGTPDAGPPNLIVWIAPPAGTGLSAPCACTAITTTDGTAVPWTRGGAAYCTKNDLNFNIQFGDMVSCTNNTPRVTYGNADSGVLGLLVETTPTVNLANQSQQLGTGPWATDTNGGAAISVDNDGGLNPANENISTQITLSQVLQAFAMVAQVRQDMTVVSGAPYTCSVYLLGIADGLNEYMWVYDGVSNIGVQRCDYLTTGWTRCRTTFTPASTNARIHFGNNRFGLTTSADTGPSTVRVSKFQCEAGTAVTSPVNTAAGTGTRAADFNTISVTGQLLSSVADGGCGAMTVLPLGPGPMAAGLEVTNTGRPLYFNTSLRANDGTHEIVLSGGLTSFVEKHYRSTWQNVTLSLFNDTDVTSTTGTFGNMATTLPLRLGNASFISNTGDWVIKDFQLGTTASSCH